MIKNFKYFAIIAIILAIIFIIADRIVHQEMKMVIGAGVIKNMETIAGALESWKRDNAGHLPNDLIVLSKTSSKPLTYYINDSLLNPFDNSRKPYTDYVVIMNSNVPQKYESTPLKAGNIVIFIFDNNKKYEIWAGGPDDHPLWHLSGN